MSHEINWEISSLYPVLHSCPNIAAQELAGYWVAGYLKLFAAGLSMNSVPAKRVVHSVISYGSHTDLILFLNVVRGETSKWTIRPSHVSLVLIPADPPQVHPVQPQDLSRSAAVKGFRLVSSPRNWTSPVSQSPSRCRSRILSGYSN